MSNLAAYVVPLIGASAAFILVTLVAVALCRAAAEADARLESEARREVLAQAARDLRDAA